MKLKAKNLLFSDQTQVEFEVGNYYKRKLKGAREVKMQDTTKSLCHEFTVFFRIKYPKDQNSKLAATKVLESVEFNPHPSYKMKPVVRKFEVGKDAIFGELSWKNMAWAPFDVPIKINFQKHLDMQPMEVTWILNFVDDF
jgi:hypothetical protein